MGLGLVASAGGAIKFISIKTLWENPDPASGFSWILKIGAFVETSLGTWAACIPCLKAPFEAALKKCGVNVTYGSQNVEPTGNGQSPNSSIKFMAHRIR
jgi:hypothetical protein